uniref:Uncharacterized protein n=1 Tax=Vitis vinifera TaxID=29760 RepID=F6H694_VITVI
MLVRRLAKDGGSGVEVRVIPMLTEIIIHATQTQNVLCKQGRRELAARVQKISTQSPTMPSFDQVIIQASSLTAGSPLHGYLWATCHLPLSSSLFCFYK